MFSGSCILSWFARKVEICSGMVSSEAICRKEGRVRRGLSSSSSLGASKVVIFFVVDDCKYMVTRMGEVDEL